MTFKLEDKLIDKGKEYLINPPAAVPLGKTSITSIEVNKELEIIELNKPSKSKPPHKGGIKNR